MSERDTSELSPHNCTFFIHFAFIIHDSSAAVIVPVERGVCMRYHRFLRTRRRREMDDDSETTPKWYES